LLIAAPVLEVDRLVRDVPVAAEDHFAARIAQLQQMRKELRKEAELRELADRRARTRRQVYADDAQAPEIGFHVAAFDVELAAAESGAQDRGLLAVQRDSAVSLASRGVKSRVRLARRRERFGYIVHMRLDLLQAYDIPGLDAPEPAHQSFALSGANAVYVECDDSHQQFSSSSAVYWALRRRAAFFTFAMSDFRQAF